MDCLRRHGHKSKRCPPPARPSVLHPSLGLCGCREQLINFTISKYHGSFLRLLIIILDVTMKKCKGRASSIKRETPATPSPEKLPGKKQRLLPSPPTVRNLRRKGTPSCCTFGCHRNVLYPGYFFCHNCSEWDPITATVQKSKRATKSTKVHSSTHIVYFPYRQT